MHFMGAFSGPVRLDAARPDPAATAQAAAASMASRVRDTRFDGAPFLGRFRVGSVFPQILEFGFEGAAVDVVDADRFFRQHRAALAGDLAEAAGDEDAVGYGIVVPAPG